MKVKICGIRRIEDALAAANAGADALGFLVGQKHTSPDFLTPEEAKKIVTSLPPFVSSVLVTHLEDSKEVLNLIRDIGVSTVQIHSEMSPDDILLIRRAIPSLRILKSFHVTSAEVLGYGDPYLPVVDGFVLDSLNLKTGQVGGTGLTHDWNLSASIVKRYSKPVLLAGGLNPDNVEEAIRVVQPFGVDVNSGTKGADGFKDPMKVREFVTRARQAWV